MEVKTSLFSDDSLSKMDRIIFDYYYSLSSIAASKGNYTQASDYLSELLKSVEESVIVFDLQAKIAAQQGKFREAEFLWKKCIKAEPDNLNYIAALNRINKLQSSKAVRFSEILRLLQFAGIIILFLFLLGVFIFDRIERKDQLTLLINKYDAISMQNNSVVNSKIIKNELLHNIYDRIKTLKGIKMDIKDKELNLIFYNGLFSKGIKLKSFQKKNLFLLAKILSNYAGKIEVKVIGSTDDKPILKSKNFKNNEALSISRAKIVFDLIYTASRIPIEDLSIGGLSEVNSFFPNNSPENRLCNRTVIIKIIQK